MLAALHVCVCVCCLTESREVPRSVHDRGPENDPGEVCDFLDALLGLQTLRGLHRPGLQSGGLIRRRLTSRQPHTTTIT